MVVQPQVQINGEIISPVQQMPPDDIVTSRPDENSPQRSAARPLEELRPFLRQYLPANLYEPLERRPRQQDLEAVRDHLTALLGTCKTYLPRPVILSPQPPGIASGGMQRGVFLFGDVSGFTPLSEKLKVLGQAGAEQITAIINSLFTALTSTLFIHGGTLLKFGGDAMLGMWPGDTPEELAEGAMHACQAALAIQEVLQQPQFAQIEALGEKHALLIKVGISAGPYFAAHVGTPPSAMNQNGTMVFITTGQTVNLAEEAEGHAHPGQIAMTKYAADLLEGRVETGSVEREPDPGYLRLVSAPQIWQINCTTTRSARKRCPGRWKPRSAI
jgi:class 3 adenylate cyclase